MCPMQAVKVIKVMRASEAIRSWHIFRQLLAGKIELIKSNIKLAANDPEEINAYMTFIRGSFVTHYFSRTINPVNLEEMKKYEKRRLGFVVMVFQSEEM